MSNKLKQTLLFGNGLNYGIGKTWTQLLLKLKQGHIIEDGTLPNTMKYEQTLLKRLIKESNDIFSEEFKIKSEVKQHMDDLVPPKIYDELINLEFDNYITTNYDNIFEKAYQNNSINNIEISHKSTEIIYSIRRYKQLNNCKLWHIHGEINQPKSIMLGMDQYIGSVSKIDDYIKGNYKFSNGSTKYSIEDKLLQNNFDEISWVELFFNSDIHILGFGLDYSEIDLWWILNKRARLGKTQKLKNKIFFYTKKLTFQECDKLSIEEKAESKQNIKEYDEKINLLKSFNVVVEELNVKNYEECYKETIKKIKIKVLN